MNPTLPLPDPLPQPAPTWLLWFLLVLTFFLHILAMDFILGGSLIAVLLGGSPGPARRLRSWLGHAMPVLVAATITLGVAPLLFLQVLYGRLFFTSSVLMGWFWLGILPLLMIGYYGVYLIAFRGERLGRAATAVRWIVAALFIGIAFLLVNNMSLMLRAGSFGTMYQQEGRGLLLNSDDATLAPRYLHFLIAAVAVSALIVAAYGLFQRTRDASFAEWAMRRGAIWFASATLVNLLAGTWFLVALPTEIRGRFLGASSLATSLLGVGVLLLLGAMIMGFMAWTAPRPAPLVRGALIGVGAGLVAMVLVRDQLRRAALDGFGFQGVRWIAPQWGNIVLFGVLLVTAIVTVTWMVLAFVRSRAVDAGAGESLPEPEA
ncbi:MAG: hypothetical protein PVF68_10905 [Acidobacteriota bacterium]|jgi:hypothetical protein